LILDLGLGLREEFFLTFLFPIRFRIHSFPNSVYSLEMALVPLIEPSDHLGVDRVGEHCVNHTLDLLVGHSWRG
jgi:hypothetical protein